MTELKGTIGPRQIYALYWVSF